MATGSGSALEEATKSSSAVWKDSSESSCEQQVKSAHGIEPVCCEESHPVHFQQLAKIQSRKEIKA